MTRLEKIISDINAGIYKKYHMGGFKEYRQQINNLNAVQHPYVTRHSGNNLAIYITNRVGKKVAYTYFEGVAGLGFHICNLVKKDVENWIKKNKVFDYKKYEDPDYNEQFFNLDKIEKNIGKPMIGIDVNGCYFNTLFKLKYISRRTYDMAYRKVDEWKTGRNASVGMLAKEVVYILYDFKKGVRWRMDRIVVDNKRKKAIRHHIIGSVWKTFKELFGELNNDYYMFLTDCIYVDPKHLNKVQKFFEGKGYTSKYKDFKLTKLDKSIKRIYWWDELKVDKEKGRDGTKWYNYSETQISKPISKIKKHTEKKVKNKSKK